MPKTSVSKVLLVCGILGALVYPITDIIAGNLYPGYSFNEQSVSELFAIGAPTSHLVAGLFTLSSVLYIAFALGIWLSSDKRLLRVLSVMIFAGAINCLLLWNFFPMHMRDAEKTFTDTMHLILAVNPFIIITIILGAVFFKNWFRYYSLIAILLLLVPAVLSFSLAPLLAAHQPTPMLGIYERISQYNHLLWHAVLAVVLIRKKAWV